MEALELQTVWRGDLWRDFYHPKPAPPVVVEPCGSNHAQRRKTIAKTTTLLAVLREKPQTMRQLAEGGQFGTVWNVRILIRRLRAHGLIQAVGSRPGSDGPPATVWGVVK